MNIYAVFYHTHEGKPIEACGDRASIRLDEHNSTSIARQTAISRGFTHYRLIRGPRLLDARPISPITPVTSPFPCEQPPSHTTPHTRTLHNSSTQSTEEATLQICPRCHGHGLTTEDRNSEGCYLCNGHGRVWRTPTGWTVPFYGRQESGLLW